MDNNFEGPPGGDYSQYGRPGERFARHYARRSGCRHFGGDPRWPARQGIGFAVIMIVFGLFLFLDNIGVFSIRDLWQYWPVAIAVVGFQQMVSTRLWSGRVWGGLLVVVAALLIAHNMGVLTWPMGAIWSLFLAGVGFSLLVKNFEEPPALVVEGVESGEPGTEPAEGVSSESYLKQTYVFSGTKRRIETKDFRGGELIAIFGGIELDLRRAGVLDPSQNVVIDTVAVFGGIVIRVPETWRVVLRGVAVFGAYEDKTIPPVPVAGVVPPTLVVTGSAVFGAVNIE